MSIDMGRLDAATRVAQAAQEASDKIVLDTVHARMQELFPDHDSWAREYIGYEDMPGGDWCLYSVKVEDSQMVLAGTDEFEWLTEEINDALAMLFQWGEAGERLEKELH